jgi:small subunit ribosomal protein S1
MADQPPRNDPGEDFAALFAEAERGNKGKARQRRYAVGDRVRGKLLSIGREVAVVELEGGGEGTLEMPDLRDEDGQLIAQVGETIEARVVETGEKEGMVTLKRALARGPDARAGLTQAIETGLPVDGVITAVNKGGVEVMVGAVRAFCPMSQLDLRPVADPSALVGQKLAFRVSRYEDDRRGPNVVLSRRALLEEDARARAVETRRTLAPGAVVPGVVTALKDFGAFVDLGGLDGLLPASEIGYQRGTRPADVLSLGQHVMVQVLRMEKRDDAKRPDQITLSLKSLEEDPWDEAARRLPAGTTARGKVTRTEAFGAFVELAPGVEGLLHISELGGGKQALRHARDAVKPGDELEVTVLSVDLEKRRLSLGLASREERVDDEGRAAAARASSPGSGLGTLGDLLKGKLPGR